jgi:hypothetical protein
LQFNGEYTCTQKLLLGLIPPLPVDQTVTKQALLSLEKESMDMDMSSMTLVTKDRPLSGLIA